MLKKEGGLKTFSQQGARCKLHARQLKQFSYSTHKNKTHSSINKTNKAIQNLYKHI